MKKIRLDLESLKVESFVTSGRSGGSEGTVFGMLNTYCDDTCNEISPSCAGTYDPATNPCHSLAECDWTYPQATTCTSPYGTTGGDTEDWTCDACAASCNSEECKTE